MAEAVGLGAPEALVLLSLPQFDTQRAIKLGLLSLTMQGILRLDAEQRDGFLRHRQALRLRLAGEPPQALSPPLASLVEVTRAAGENPSMSEFVKAARREYGRTLTGFVLKIVGPHLAALGLAQERHMRILGLLPTTRFYPTSAGEEERRRLSEAMRAARSIPDFLDRDPAQAVALAAAAGSSVLLVDELKPHYGRLAEALRASQYRLPDLSAAADGLLAGQAASSPEANSGGFDFGAFDFGAFDSFEAGCQAFDAGFDAACDAGGADGGPSC